MLKTLLTCKPVISNAVTFTSSAKPIIYEQKHYQPAVSVSVMTTPKRELKLIQANIVTVAAPKVEEKREESNFNDTLQYLKSKKNEIKVITARGSREARTIPLAYAQSDETQIVAEPMIENKKYESEAIYQKTFVAKSERLQVFEKEDESADDIEIEDTVELPHASKVEPYVETIVRKDGYYSNSDFEITKIGNKYRVKRKSDKKVFTLRDKNKETIYVKNILAGYDVENNEYELISAISGYQKEQDKNRRRRNRRRWKRAGKIVLGAASALAYATKNGGAAGVSQRLKNGTNSTNGNTTNVSTTSYTSTSLSDFPQKTMITNNIVYAPGNTTTKIYGTTNGFQNITPDAVVESDQFTKTTKVYGTINGFKNISPDVIIEKDSFSDMQKVYGTTNGFKNISPSVVVEKDYFDKNKIKVYGTTNGFKNMSPDTIVERDPYSNTTKVYGTTNGFKNMSPNAIIEEDPYSNTTKVYGTTNGFKNMSPNAIIKRTDY